MKMKKKVNSPLVPCLPSTLLLVAFLGSCMISLVPRSIFGSHEFEKNRMGHVVV